MLSSSRHLIFFTLWQETLLNLDDREDKLTKRYAMIKESAVKIHQLLEVNWKWHSTELKVTEAIIILPLDGIILQN